MNFDHHQKNDVTKVIGVEKNDDLDMFE